MTPRPQSPPFVLSCTFNHFHSISSHYDRPRNSGLVKPGAHTRSLNTHGQLSQRLGTLPYLYIERCEMVVSELHAFSRMYQTFIFKVGLAVGN